MINCGDKANDRDKKTAKNYYVKSGQDLRSTSNSISDMISMERFLGI